MAHSRDTGELERLDWEVENQLSEKSVVSFVLD